MKTDEVCDRYLETFGRRYFWGYLRLILSVSWINTRKFYERVANSIARKGVQRGNDPFAGSSGSAPWVSPINHEKAAVLRIRLPQRLGLLRELRVPEIRGQENVVTGQAVRASSRLMEVTHHQDGAIVAVAVILDFFPGCESCFLRGGGGHLEHEFLQMLIVRPAGIIRRQDRKSTRLNSSHRPLSRMPSSA